jgi:hypothetical protein
MAKAAVIRLRSVVGLSGARAGLLQTEHGDDHEGAPNEQRRDRDRLLGKPDRRQRDARGHHQVVARPHAQSIDTIEQWADHNRGEGCGTPEDRPGEAKHCGIVHHLAGHGRQEGGR